MADTVLLKKETTPSTFVTPSGTDFVAVRNWNASVGESFIEDRQTGVGRGKSGHYDGSKLPSGSGEMSLLPEMFGLLLVAAGFNSRATGTPSGGTTSIEHGFAIDDNLAFEALSAQLQQERGGGSSVLNIKGIRVNSFTINIEQDAVVSLSFEYIAQDESKAGVDFEDATSSATKVTATIPTALTPFKFDHFVLKTGVTPTWDNTGKYFTFTGGTTISNIVSLTIDFANNISQNVYLGKRTGDRVAYGNREITLSMTVANDVASTTWYDKIGTEEAVAITLTSNALAEVGVPYIFEIVLPKIKYTDAPIGELSGEYGERDIEVTGSALVHSTSGKDVAIRTIDNVASY